MKIATNKWNIRVANQEHTLPALYFGFKTKREAIHFAKEWNATHTMQVEAVKYDNGKWVRI